MASAGKVMGKACYGSRIRMDIEHAFQALKAASHEEFRQVLESPTARVAWEAGRRLDLRPDWDSVKIEVMRDLVGRKFEEDGLAMRLQETGEAALIAGNRWHDGYWGVCRCPACAGVGANALGVVLMWVREAWRRDFACAGSPGRT